MRLDRMSLVVGVLPIRSLVYSEVMKCDKVSAFFVVFLLWWRNIFYCSCVIRSGCLLVRKQWFHPSFSAGADTCSTISPSTLVLQCPVNSAQPSCGTIHHWLDCGTRSLLLCQRAWTGFSLGELHQPNTFAMNAVVLISSFVLIFNSVFY